MSTEATPVVAEPAPASRSGPSLGRLMRQPRAKHGIHWWLAGLLGYGIVRAIGGGVRLRFHGEETVRAWESAGRRFVLAFWHRHLLMIPFVYRGTGIATMASQSDAGELATRVLARFGFGATRGSNSRGGVAGLHDLVRRGRAGSDLALAPDGPRGPAGEVKAGVVVAASLLGFPIVPVAFAARHAWRAPGWDQAIVPFPGSAVHVVFGEALTLPPGTDLAAGAAALKDRLNATEAAARSFARGGRNA